MNGGVDGADAFARRGLAVLAHHRLVHDLRVINPCLLVLIPVGLQNFVLLRADFFRRRRAGEITVNAQPEHLTAATHLILADDRHVVLALTRDDTGVAAGAGVQVNGHAPLVQTLRFDRVERIRVERLVASGRRRKIERLNRLWIAHLLRRDLANDRAAFQRPMILRAGETVLLRDGGNFRTDSEALVRRTAQRVEVEADLLAVEVRDASALRATEAERETKRVVRHAGHDPHGCAHGLASEREFDELRVLHAEVHRRLAADEHGVVPCHLGDRIGDFHEPAVVGPAAIIHAVVAGENDFEIVLRRRGDGDIRQRGRENGGVESDGDRLARGVRDEAVMQRLLPRFFAKAGSFARDFVSVGFRQTADAGEHFEFRQATEQRLDERLDDDGRAVRRFHIAPRFKVVRGREILIREGGSFVLVVTEADNGLGLALRGGPVEIRRSVIDRVAAKDDERVHFALVERFGELGNPLLFQIRRLAELHRLAERTERGIDGVRQQMHRDGLTITRDDKRRRAARLQIIRAFFNPLRIDARRQRELARIETRDELRGNRRSNRSHLAGRHAQAVVGVHARLRHQRFRDVETVHRVLRRATALGKIARVQMRLAIATEEITVEREDGLRLIVFEIRRDRAPHRDGRGLPVNVEIHRFVRVELRGGKLLLNRLLHTLAGRRRAALQKERQTRTLVCGKFRGDVAELGQRRFARAVELRAIRIVEAEDGRLRENIRAAVAVGMFGIAFDFRRATFVRLDQQWNRATARRERRRVELGDAVNVIIRQLRKRIDVLLRLAAAGTENARARQRQGRRHQLHEVAAVEVALVLARAGGELAVHPCARFRRVLQRLDAAEILGRFRLRTGRRNGFHR